MEGTTSVATKYLLDKVFVIDVVFDNGNANHDRPCVDGVRGGITTYRGYSQGRLRLRATKVFAYVTTRTETVTVCTRDGGKT